MRTMFTTACMQVVDEEEAEFPAVTICNLNVLSKSKIIKDLRKGQADVSKKLEEIIAIEERYEKFFQGCMTQYKIH